MEIKCGNQKLEAYPVEPFIYEVAANGKKEFYQDVWDAFGSNLHMNNSSAKITKIPVIPISDEQIKAEIIAIKLGEKRTYPGEYIKEFKNTKPKVQKNTKTRPKKKITLKRVLYVLAFAVWLTWLIGALVLLFNSR
ncbi:hypothetical protein CBF86_01935 [Limosilactobacillus reuteri]|uniref:hypothetical protein n=1 Tax=Limosilactobacillus reuteri TaxID=1598 RepID=UPI000B991A4C|nr:hypothetical protein [Limosilactobacillus reuteri]OYS49826.1 hypothetical protein CBF86_01935 [Limosilactobacillus reuteri]OYS50711.1 hypothetical protein CBF84_02315 [Limosilactobacillus reuteri]OYS55203.1 hypothetical protein CBF92_02425 [Limosilactobacillus reuteri]OYS56501.1 hypothetical protein CBF95_02700 [Limosilactobacillus reuteri]OYS62932.1 hypothetical protein CBF93_02720 [Limosilactobacillus reuteri]